MPNQDGYVSPFAPSTPASSLEPVKEPVNTSSSDSYVSPFSDPPPRSPEPVAAKESGGDVSSYVSPFGSSSLSEPASQDAPAKLSSKSEPSNPDDPWYKKLWDFTNAPLIDNQNLKNWFGWDVEHWNGWGKGLMDLAEGLTSPLSIALAVGTFGESALAGVGIKAAGKVALEGVMAADEIAEVTKGSKFLAAAIKGGFLEDLAYQAMTAQGINQFTVKRGLAELAKAGLSGQSLLANGIIRQTGGTMLRAAGVEIGTADKVASGAQFLIDAGFTVQNAYGAVIAAPRVLDALKEGDYETAKRLAVDAIGSGAFAVLGGRAAHEHAGELMTNSEAALGLRVKPSEENLKLIKLLEPVERERIVAGERERQWADTAREEHEIPKDKTWIAGGASESDLRARFYRESEGRESIDNMAGWHDAIAEAAGRQGEKIGTGVKRAFSEEGRDVGPDGLHPDDRFLLPSGKVIGAENQEELHNDTAARVLGYDATTAAKAGRSPAEELGQLGAIRIFKNQNNLYVELHSRPTSTQIEVLGRAAKDTDRKITWDLYRNGELIKSSPGPTYLGEMQRSLDIYPHPPDERFPPDVQEWIDRQKLKDKPTEYVDQLLKASDPRLLTEQEIKYAKHVGDHFDETGMRALGEESLSSLFDSYVTRVWKKVKNEDADVVKKFRVIANSPEFSVNTVMARKRVFQTTLEGLLKGNELEDHDMVSLAAFNGNEFSKVSSHRQVLQKLRGAGIRASDGRPMAALAGAGHLVESFDENGEVVNPATIIHPKAMQSVRMADKVVDGLKSTVHRPEADATRPAPGMVRLYKAEGATSWDTGFDAARQSGKPVSFIDVPVAEADHYKFSGPERRSGPRTDTDAQIDYKARFGELRQAIAEAKTPEEKAMAERRLDEYKQIVEARKNGYKQPEAKPVDVEPAFTQLDQLMKEGRVVKFGVDRRTGNPLYAWTAHDYLTVTRPDGTAHPAFTGWKVPVTDTNGNTIYVKTELKLHPEMHEYMQRRFGDDSLTRKVPGLSGAMAVAREAKGLLLGFSPFHLVQEGLRAIMTGISPIGNERFNPANPMHVLAAEKGVWEFKDYRGIRGFEDGLIGHSKLIAKIPGLREIQSWTQSLLFDRYIPGLKLRAFERMYKENERLHGKEWSKEKIANETADEVNERFGGLPYKRIGRSLATMDVNRLVALAPDWLESEMRFMHRLFKGSEGELARRDTAKMAVGLWAVSRLLNYLVSGKPHHEAPFGVAYTDDDGRTKVYSLRTMPTDILHAASDPLGFMNGRLSPLVRTGVQTISGRDEFGRKMSSNGVFVNLLRNVAPISLQTAAKKMTGEDPGISNLDAGYKAAGGTVHPYRTEAQKLAAQIASEKSEQGTVEPDKLRRNQTIITLEDRLRTGQTPVSDIYNAVERGVLHPDEAKKIIKTATETQGMDHEMARLYAHATRAPFSDMIRVFDLATNAEKAVLAQLLVRKKGQFLKKAYKEMSPAERLSDPSYIWIKRHFPQEAPF